MRTKTKASFIAITALLATGVCSITIGAAVPKQVNVEVTDSEFMAQNDIVRLVEVPTGGILNMTLASNLTTGFSWNKVAEIGDHSVLQETENKYSEQETNGVVGAGGWETWTFRALKPGVTTIRMEYSQPWPSGQKAVWAFQLTVVVR